MTEHLESFSHVSTCDKFSEPYLPVIRQGIASTLRGLGVEPSWLWWMVMKLRQLDAADHEASVEEVIRLRNAI